MDIQKRGRGRPKGSGLPDGDRLDRVADLLIARPELKPTTAIKQTSPAPSETELRRLQGKWKVEGDTRLTDARARLAARREAQANRSATRRSGGGGAGLIGAAAEMERQMRGLQRLSDLASGIDRMSTLADAAAGIDRSTAAMRAIYESPVMKIARGLDDNPVMRAARGLNDSPTMRLIQEMENSPTMRLIREMENSPTMRLAREMKKLGL